MEEENGFKCVICNRDERYESDWLHHITSIGHQRTIARRPGGGHGHWLEAGFEKRSFIISGCQKINGTPYQIGQYLTKFGKLEEFCCPTSNSGTKPEEVFCLFDTPEAVEKMLEVGCHRICGNVVQIKMKYSDIPPSQDSVPSSGSGNDEVDENVCNGGKRNYDEYENWNGDLKLEEQLIKLFNEIYLSPKEIQNCSKMVKEIEEIIRQTFSNAFVFSYGTETLSLGMKSDALRLCVDPYGNLGNKSVGVIENKSTAEQMTSNLIFQILSIHKKDGSLLFKLVSLYSISPVTAFNIPEISFTFKDTPCKIQFENFISLQKSKLLKFLSKHDLRISPISMLLRHWSKLHEILHNPTEGEAFENYTLILLLMFYLTKTKVIPSVVHLQSLSTTPLVINNIDVSFCSDSKVVPPTKMSYLENNSIRTLSILSILKEFFIFFAHVNFKDNVICTALGQLIPRRHFKGQMERELPTEIRDRYRYSANGDLKVQKLNTTSPICLQDPMDLTENVARGVDEMDMRQFQRNCSRTALKLEQLLESSKPNLRLLFRKDDSSETDLKRRKSGVENEEP